MKVATSTCVCTHPGPGSGPPQMRSPVGSTQALRRLADPPRGFVAAPRCRRCCERQHALSRRSRPNPCRRAPTGAALGRPPSPSLSSATRPRQRGSVTLLRRLAVLVDQKDGALHRRQLQRSRLSLWYGLGRRTRSNSSKVRIDRDDAAHEHALHLVRAHRCPQPEHHANTIAEMKNRAIQSGAGIKPAAPWSDPGKLAHASDVRSSHLPYAASSFGERGQRRLQRLEHRRAPRVEVLAQRCRSRSGPSHSPMTDRACRPARRSARRRQRRRDWSLSICWASDQRLALRSGAGRIVALETDEDQETEQHENPVAIHAEIPRGTITVRQAAAFQRAVAPRASPQPRACHDEDDCRRSDDVHALQRHTFDDASPHTPSSCGSAPRAAAQHSLLSPTRPALAMIDR